MSIDQNNWLIAEFMGFIHATDPEKRSWEMEEGFKYHSSWEQLMPVVEKIESMNGDIVLFNRCFDIRFENYVQQYHSTISRLDATYNGIVRFIQWYNTTNSTTNV